MPSTREIRRRIRGIKNIKQVTRAMNMIAAARLRRAQEKVDAACSYAERFQSVVDDVFSHLAAGVRHPLLEKRPVRRVGIVLVTSDRGLAGPYNVNVIRRTYEFVTRQRADVRMITVGKKGRGYFESLGAPIDEHVDQPSRDVTIEEVSSISKRVRTDFVHGRYDRVHLAYTEFTSVLRSTASVAELLPIESTAVDKTQAVHRTAHQFEPSPEQMLDTLLPLYVEVKIYRALVESLASEQASRMLAMKNATESASDMIDHLTREYNRARQASITEELLEVVSGSAALEGPRESRGRER